MLHIAGILVGGDSRRMRQPKALLMSPQGRTMVEHVVDAARGVADEIVLLGDSPSLPCSLEDLTILPDAKPKAGPLAGLCSLLQHARDHWSVLLACAICLILAQVPQL